MRRDARGPPDANLHRLLHQPFVFRARLLPAGEKPRRLCDDTIFGPGVIFQQKTKVDVFRFSVCLFIYLHTCVGACE